MFCAVDETLEETADDTFWDDTAEDVYRDVVDDGRLETKRLDTAESSDDASLDTRGA